MKHNLKRLTALILALSMALSLLSATAWATEADEDDTVTTGDTDMELEGTNDVGNLIAGALSETEEEQTSEENYICDVEVEGTTATVTYNISESSVEADVVVAIYDEDTQQMLASGTTTVSSDDSSCTVTIEGAMPTYFLVTAYLLEADTHQPLSAEYTSQLYTQEMQEFLVKTANDFEEEQVLNLDDDATTNFLVYSEGTVVVDESSSDVTVTDNGDGTYTVTNADATFTGLQAGNTLSYTYEDGTVLIVKVKSVSVDGSTVTITEDQDADLSDVFDYVKIESDGSEGTLAVDNSELEDGIEYLGEEVSASAVDTEGEISHTTSYSFNKKFVDTDEGSVTFKGSLSYGFSVKVKLYLSLSYQYVSLSVDVKASLSASLTGKASAEIPIGTLTYAILPGMLIVLQPVFEVEASASLSGKGTLKATIGAYYDSDQSGIHSLCSKPTTSFETSFEGKLSFGINQKSCLALISEDMVSFSFDNEVGVEISMKKAIQTLSSTSTSELHTCILCFAGEVNGTYSSSVSLDIWKGKINKKETFVEISLKLMDFYYSADHSERGTGTCPYISYLCTITVQDSSGDPVSGAALSCSALEDAVETDEDGAATFYLPNGTYTLTISKGDVQTTKTITMKDNKKSVTYTLDSSTDEEEEGDSSEDSGDTSEGEDGSDAGVETVASGTCGDDLTWVLDVTGVLNISGTGDMENWSSYSSVPWYSYRSSITSLTIGNDITSIGEYAFYNCTRLTTVTIPDNVTTIGKYAFYHCTGLTSAGPIGGGYSIEFGWFESIPAYAFYYCTGLTSVTIPESVTSIGEYAFSFCESLTSVTIPDNITSIGNSAFWYCTSLTSMTIPESVTSIGISVFRNCTSLTSVTIPNSVTSIGAYAFYSCTGLTSVDIPDSVISIGNWAFQQCSNLTSVAIPDSVTSIGKDAFHTCGKLTNVIIPDSVTSIGDEAFAYCKSLTSVDIPDSVISFGDNMFYSCTSLTSVIIGNGVTSIGLYTFYNCTSLTNVTIPTSVTSIQGLAFYNCTSLTSMTIPDSVTSIWSSAFNYCTSLTSIIIPDSVTFIWNYAFENCISLTDVYYTGSKSDWADISISSTGNSYLTNATIHYNYDATVSAAAVDESSESVTAAETEPESEPEPEPEPETEDEIETETEVEPETSTEGESEVEVTETTATCGDLSLDYLLSGGGAVVPLMAYTGSTTSTDNTQTAAFTGLVSGEAYVLLAVKDAEADNLLAADNLLYIAQANADDSGSVTFTYIPRETVDTAVSYAYGTSSQNLADAEITLEADSFGYTGGAIKPLATVVYNGVTLEENEDYTISYADNTAVGTATATIKGRGDYAGTVKKTFTIVKGTQSVTASVSASSIIVGETAQIAATAQGTLSYESSDTAVATVDENGLVTGVGAGTATITVTAAETDNFESGSMTLTVKVLLATPTLSSVSNTTSGVKITWKAVSGAAKYRVFRKTGSGSWAKVADTTSTSYTDTTAKSGTSYTYTVRCINSAGKAYTSNYNKTGLSIKYLTAGTISSLTNISSGITVKWSKVSGASGYYVYRKTSGGSYSKIATVTSGSTVSYTDTDVKSKNGTTYVYAVRPYSGSTKGSYTGKTTVRLTGVNISSLKNVKTKKMTVKWGQNSKATGYQIQYSTSSDFSSGSKTVTVTSYKTVSKTISSLTKGKKYYVRVRAYKTVSDTKYYSAWSGTKNVKISK